MVACLSVCFLSSAVSEDEVSVLQTLLVELQQCHLPLHGFCLLPVLNRVGDLAGPG